MSQYTFDVEFEKVSIDLELANLSIDVELEQEDIMELRQGDYGYIITMTVKNSSGVVEDLTGITGVTFEVATIDDLRNIISSAAVVSSAEDGEVQYTVQDGDFDIVGNYVGVLKVAYTGKILTTKDFNITVKRKLT